MIVKVFKSKRVICGYMPLAEDSLMLANDSLDAR